MGLFNFGGSKSRSSSSSQSSSSSFDNLDASGFNFGLTGSESGGASGSVSGGASRSQDTLAFEDLFAKLFGGAGDAASAVNTGGLTDTANLLFGSGSEFLSGLGGGPGASFLEERLAESDGLVDDQISQLSGDIGEFLSETVNPAITSGGVAASTLGGSRGEVQKGLATEAALEEFVRGSTQIRKDERGRTDALAQFLAGDETNRTTVGLNALPALFGLAEGGTMAGLSPFLALSQIMGGPTVLGSSESADSASSFGSQFGSSFGFDIGADSTTGRAGSKSQSSGKSSSSSKSFNFGFGGK